MEGMTVREIRQMLNRMVEVDPKADNRRFGIIVDEPSFGSQICVSIKKIYKGFDWDNDAVLAITDKAIVRKIR